MPTSFRTAVTALKKSSKAGVKIARKAVEGTDALVALDIGPIGQLLEPAGSMKFDEAYEYYKQQILAGKDADVIVLKQ